MTTIGAQRIEFLPERDILGKKNITCCLSPIWMCWMPWLKDGVDVQAESKKGIIKEEDQPLSSGRS